MAVRPCQLIAKFLSAPVLLVAKLFLVVKGLCHCSVLLLVAGPVRNIKNSKEKLVISELFVTCLLLWLLC